MTNFVEYKEFENKLNNSEAALVGKVLYYVTQKEKESGGRILVKAEDPYTSIDILESALSNGVSFNETYGTYTVGDLEYPIKLLQASAPTEPITNADITSLSSLDYYPSIPEGKLYCICGVDVVKKKELAIRMRELAINYCPYVIIDSANSRHFISHCSGHDIITALNNNMQIAEITEMIIKQGINVIVLTARSEIVYVLLKDKIGEAAITDITTVDIASITSEEELTKIWR